MGTVAFQSFHSYIVSKIKTTAHDNPESNYYATKAEWIDSKTYITVPLYRSSRTFSILTSDLTDTPDEYSSKTKAN